MDTAARTTVAERLGRTLGRAAKACVRLNRRTQSWLIARGWSPGMARLSVTLAELLAIGVLLYAAMWLTLAILFAAACAWIAGKDDGRFEQEQKAEWRDGVAGYGLYTPNDQRIDLHDPD